MVADSRQRSTCSALRWPVTDQGPCVRVLDLGRMGYADALRMQRECVDEVLAARDAGVPQAGRVLVVEHDPVITISRRAGARDHLLADASRLSQLGVEVADTDRGGDITYHGPGQLVVYPILDLNRLNLGLHAYMRLLEQVVIDACTKWGLPAERDPAATGVWVRRDTDTAKVAAMGVRIRRWVSMHGLAVNIDPDMSHFNLIVPCGLSGRTVTSIAAEVESRRLAPVTFAGAKAELVELLIEAVKVVAERADEARESPVTSTPPRTD